MGEKVAARWACSWFLERLGLGYVKDCLRPLLTRWPPLQLPFLLLLLRETGVSMSDAISYWREALEVEKYLQDRWEKEQGACGRAGMLDFSAGRLLYALVRAVKPRVSVETGVANGSSTTFILSALKANGSGELRSLDLPVTPDGKTFIPEGRQPGWLVPSSLHPYWHLSLGDTRILLPALLKDLKRIDLFFHDSDHSYETMTFEYSLAWSVLAPGGWLTSDDVGFNGAFPEWSLSFAKRHWVWADRLGIAKKPDSPLPAQ